MPSSIRWLHFSDLHQGMHEQSWMWPSVESALFDDLERQHKLSGPWDLVLFTGDLTQHGTQHHFDLLDKTLDKLWTLFAKLGFSPLLLAVPGNHDLVRPDSRNPVLKAMKGWEQDEEVQQEIYSHEKNEYNLLFKKAFQPFTDWYLQWLNKHPCPPELKHQWAERSLLPGDFSVTIEKEGLVFGVVGLNSSFMQLTSEDYQGRLLLLPTQLTTLHQNPHDWAKICHATLLMTHHPVSWLHPKSREDYNAYINPDDLFTAHLFGHMHEPHIVSISEGGSLRPRLLWQSPSLFGLERWGNTAIRNERRHGYSISELSVVDGRGSLRIWPREGRKKQGGSWGLAPDTSYHNLHDEALMQIFSPKRSIQAPLSSPSRTASAKVTRISLKKSGAESQELEPQYPDEETRQASRHYQAALERLSRLRSVGATGSALELAVNNVSSAKRALREGRQLMPGEILDERYLVLGKLGKGGFATVWKAKDLHSSSVVAVKVLHGHCAHDRSQRERFTIGIREMARLEHSHVVRVLEPYQIDGGYSLPDGQVLGGNHYFVMEYLEGGDLHQAIRAQSLSITDIWRVLDEILLALEYSHSQGIIHRDVKPENILLSADGRAKLTDFDLARAAESSHGTRTGALGTVFYAAPEAHNSGTVLDERADIYSFAMTAIFALRGKEWTYEEFLRPTRVLNELRPKTVSIILAKALAINREHRYSSMTAFREVLCRAAVRGRERAPTFVRKSGGGRLADLMLRAQRSSPTYKPACMLSVLDAFEAREVSLEQIEPNVIFRRFDKILEESTGKCWLPFFHLSTDGFWEFVKDGRVVALDEFVDRRPASRKNILNKIDFAVVPEIQREWWSDTTERINLRRTLLEMLGQSKASLIGDAEVFSEEVNEPSDSIQNLSSPSEDEYSD